MSDHEHWDEDVPGRKPFEFTANWQADEFAAETLRRSFEPQRTMQIIPKGSRWFDVDWFPSSLVSQNVTLQHAHAQPDDDGMTTASMSFTAQEPFVKSRAEWWRWVGYYVIACPLDALEGLLQRWRGDTDDGEDDDGE